METYKKRTFAVLFSDDEWECFDKALFQSGYKKQIYVRNLIIKDMQKHGWLPQQEKTAEPAIQEG